MDTPWIAIAPAENNREYLAFLSYFALKSYGGLPRFAHFAVSIAQQMRGTPGAIGLTLRGKLLARDFWTLSAWQDDHALREFVVRPPHGEAMKAMEPYMSAVKFLRWKVTGGELPLRWTDAMRRFEQGAQK